MRFPQSGASWMVGAVVYVAFPLTTHAAVTIEDSSVIYPVTMIPGRTIGDSVRAQSPIKKAESFVPVGYTTWDYT
jgi:hypothetical protein